MNESTARRKHREANDGQEPEWATVGFRNPRRIWESVEEREAWYRREFTRRNEVLVEKELARVEREREKQALADSENS